MIVGYTMLHYGVDYLAYALRSLAPYVDRYVILYSATPTFGSSTTLTCPDSRDELYAIASAELGNKLIWREGLKQNNRSVLQIVPQAKLILETDADEAWPPALVAAVLRAFRRGVIHPGEYRMPMIHHWRSFGYICRDASWPGRLFRVRDAQIGDFPKWGTEIPFWNFGGAPIHHFGYARSLPDMQYKIDTSAHKHEWRAGWWEHIFTAFPQRLTDLHPVVKDQWNAEPYDRQQLPDFMHQHPWFDREVIA